MALAEGDSTAIVPLVDEMPVPVSIKDRDHAYLYVNRAFEEEFGIELPQVVGHTDDELFAPDVVRDVRIHERRILRDGASIERSEEYLSCRGKTARRFVALRFPVARNRTPCDAVGCVFLDISSEHQSALLEGKLRALLEQPTPAFFIKAPEGLTTDWNQAAERLYGYLAHEVIGKPFSVLVPADRLGEVHLMLERVREGRMIEDFVTEHLRKEGSLVHVSLTVTPVHDGEGSVIGATTVVRDISRQRLAERERADLEVQLASTARTDPLTSLPNRRAWDDELAREVARADREKRLLCAAILDLDHFKAFNDEHGHQAGDKLLRDAATLWQEELRRSDFIARYGGEEFAALMPGCRVEDALPVLQRLINLTPMGQTCSAGVAAWDGSESGEELVSRADRALFRAKGEGRNRVVPAPRA